MRRLKRAVQKAGRPTVNKLALFSLRRGIPILMLSRRTLLAIRTVGRRSGKERTTPMGYVELAGKILVVSERGTRSDWYRNAKAVEGAQALFRGRWRPIRLRAGDEDPARVLESMPSRSIAKFNRMLWDEPAVVEVVFEDQETERR